MLLVETYISISPGKGIGLYAKKKIIKGTVYWERNEIYDKIISEVELDSLPLLAAQYIRRYGFFEISGNWYLCTDNARFSNHSQTPNSINRFDSEGIVISHIASRDIEQDEEILCDYTELCQTCKEGVMFVEQN